MLGRVDGLGWCSKMGNATQQTLLKQPDFLPAPGPAISNCAPCDGVLSGARESINFTVAYIAAGDTVKDWVAGSTW